MRIQVDSVSFQYPSGVLALDGIQLVIETGDAVALLGENGAGKTTLAKHFNGLLKPSSGRVRVGEWDTNEFSTAQFAGHVGFVFQNPGDQIFNRSVWDETVFGPRNLGFTEEDIRTRSERALVQTDLLSKMDSHPYDLLESDRKLLSIASVLAMDTPVVIFDEPTLGLDAKRLKVMGTIIEDLKSKQKTLIVISHDMDFCNEYLNRFIILSEGKLVVDGLRENVLKDERTIQASGIEAPQLARLASALELHSFPRTVSDFIERFKTQRGTA